MLERLRTWAVDPLGGVPPFDGAMFQNRGCSAGYQTPEVLYGWQTACFWLFADEPYRGPIQFRVPRRSLYRRNAIQASHTLEDRKNPEQVLYLAMLFPLANCGAILALCEPFVLSFLSFWRP